MRGAGTDPHDSMHVLDGEAAGTANDTAGALASSSGTAQDAATALALTEVGSAATGVTHGAPLTVAPACPAAASAQPRCVATEAQARHAALLSRVTACGRAAGPAHEAAKASALLSDSDDGSDAEEGIAFTGDVGDARDAPLEDNTPAAVTAEQPASAMHAGGDRSSRPGADVGVGEHMHGGAARSAGAASGDGDPDTDGAEARTLSTRKMETLLEPCLRMFGFPGAVEAMVRADGSVDAVAEAAAELPPLRGAAGGQGLGEEEKEEWAERGLRVLAQYEVEAQGWQDARARVQWQRVLAEPPFEDWDRKVRPHHQFPCRNGSAVAGVSSVDGTWCPAWESMFLMGTSLPVERGQSPHVKAATSATPWSCILELCLWLRLCVHIHTYVSVTGCGDGAVVRARTRPRAMNE